MTLYPAKDRTGAYTGVWVVDGPLNATPRRLRTTDFQEAQRAESHLRRGEPLATFVGAEVQEPEDHQASESYTLARLATEAARRFEGRKDGRQSTQRLIAIVALLGPDMNIKDVRLRHLEKAASAMRASGKSPKTINRAMAAISGALKWAWRNELLDREPPKPWQPEGRGRVTFVPHDQDAPLLTWMVEQGRDRQAIVYEVLVSTGLRTGELRTLEPHEVQGEWVRLSESKNGDARDVPIDAELGQSLRAMLSAERLPSRRTIAETFAEAGEAIGLPFRLTPHVLRHTTATRLTSAQVPTAIVKDFLGHRSLRTTLQYAHVTRASLQEAAKLLRKPNSSPTPPPGPQAPA